MLARVEAHVRLGRQHLQQRVPHEVEELRQTRVRGADGVLPQPGAQPRRVGQRVPGRLRQGEGPDDVRLRRQRVPQRVRDEDAELRVSVLGAGPLPRGRRLGETGRFTDGQL